MATQNIQLKDGNGNLLMPITDIGYKWIEVDLLALRFNLYAMSGGTNWYRGTNKKQGHVAISVSPGDVYKIQTIDGCTGCYAYMTSSYTPPTSASAMPYVSGTTRAFIGTNSSTEVTIPQGCSYLVLNSFTGDDSQNKYRLYKKERYSFSERFEEDEANTVVETDELKELDLSEIAEQYCSLGSTSWYMASNDAQRHKVIPVEPNSKLRLVNNAVPAASVFVAFLKTYTVPIANGATINYSSTYPARISTTGDADKTHTDPSDAHYFIITTVDGSGATQGRNSKIFIPEIENIKQVAPDFITKKTFSRTRKLEYPLINLGSFIRTSGLYDWSAEKLYWGTFVYVGHLRGKVLTFVSTQYTLRIAFLKSRAYAENVVPRYCEGTSLINKNSTGTYQFTVPDDCMWMYIYSYSDGTFLRYNITYEDDGVRTDNFQVTEKVNLYSLELKNCAFLTTGKWYDTNITNYKHIAVPVTPKEYIRIRGTLLYYVFVSSAYTGNYSNGDDVPYVTNYKCHYTYGGEEVVQVPSNAAYVIINAKGDTAVGVEDALKYISFERGNLVKCFNETKERTNSNRLRIASWNIGHFALGTNYDTAITAGTYPTMSAKWRDKINSLNADILCCCEYNTNIVNSTSTANRVLAQRTVFSLYKYAMVGSKPSATSYMQTAIFSQFLTRCYGEFTYKNVVQVGRYAAATVVNLGGRDVVIVSTHLDWDQGEHGAEYRATQMAQLKSMFSNYPYVVICADWNVISSDEYATFTDDGWKAANVGYMGVINTHPAGDSPSGPIDNIICKGVNIKQVGIINDAELSDHCCIWADIVIDE